MLLTSAETSLKSRATHSDPTTCVACAEALSAVASAPWLSRSTKQTRCANCWSYLQVATRCIGVLGESNLNPKFSAYSDLLCILHIRDFLMSQETLSNSLSKVELKLVKPSTKKNTRKRRADFHDRNQMLPTNVSGNSVNDASPTKSLEFVGMGQIQTTVSTGILVKVG